MAKPRTIDPTGYYHVTSRGNFRQPIFVDDAHYERHLRMIEDVTRKFGWLVLDWCHLPNHFHLFVRLQDGGLSEGMQRLNGGFSRWTNSIHERTGTGHLVKNRFVSRYVEDQPHLLELCRYLPLNPVAALLANEAKEWQWSGYRATSGLTHPRPFHRPELVLSFFHDEPAEARLRLAAWVEDGHAQLRRLWARSGDAVRHPHSQPGRP
jgi:REP element-mobilizing transposase RayT